MSDQAYLNVAEAATFLRISVPQIYRLTSEHRIPHIKLGKRCVFDPDKLRGWAEQQAVEVDCK